MLLSISSVVSNEELIKFAFNCWSWLRLFIIIIQNLYCIPIYLLYNTVILLPIYYFNFEYYSYIENLLFNSLLYIVGSWSFGAGINVYECGHDIYKLIDNHKINESNSHQNDNNKLKLLIVANHQSTGDVPLMMQAFTSRSKYILLWIMDKVFKMTNFGLVSMIHGDYFLNTKKFKPGHLTKHCIKEHSLLKNAIILFPEGGFRWKRVASSNRFALNHGLSQLNNVTWPRFGAFHDLMVPEIGITHIVDLTIIYEDLQNPISVVDICRGIKKSKVIFYYKIYDLKQEQINEQWLNEKWLEKEKLMKEYYQDRSKVLNRIANDPNTQVNTMVTLNWIKLFLTHLFYLCNWFFLYTIYKQVKYLHYFYF